MCKKTVFILAFLCLNVVVQAQNTIIPEWIDIEKGLSQGYVSSLLQDKEGFMWMGTKNGLNRYDGDHFEVFTEDAENPYSIVGNHIYTLLDDNEFILVGTEQGLNVYDKTTKYFYTIPLYPTENGKQTSIVSYMLKDKFNQYWVVDWNTQFLFKLTFDDRFLQKIRKGEKINELVDIKKCKNLHKIYPHTLAILNDNIVVVDQQQNTLGEWQKSFKRIPLNSEEAFEMDSSPFTKNSERFNFFVSNNELVINFWGEKYIHVFKEKAWKKIQTAFSINKISYLQSEKKILLESNTGCFIFNEITLSQKGKINKSSATNSFNIKTHHTAWIQDNSGNHWIATSGYGVAKLGNRQSKIKTYFTGKSIYAKPFIMNKGSVYIASTASPERLGILNAANEKQELDILLDRKKNYPLCLTRDSNNAVWGLFWEDRNFEVSKLINGKRADTKVIATSSLAFTPMMAYDRAKNTIVVVFGTSLITYNLSKNRLNNYDFGDIVNGLINRYDLTITSNGHYWLGTNLGLIQAIPTNEKIGFTLFNKKNGLLSNEVASVHPDNHNKNILWIGTKGGGLHRLDIHDKSFSYINSKNGLPNDVIYGVLEDTNNNLWMSSNLGIISYNKLTKEIRNFKKSDGLQSNEFNTYAFAKSADGTMYFGGINGLNSFNKNENLPKTWITGLKVNNETVTFGDSSNILSKSVEYAEQITLPYTQNNITLTFAALEYTAANKNKFSYYLEGAETPWTHTTTDNKASYLNLSPGNYVFTLKTANGDEVWNETPKRINITILAPWYRSNIAYTLYVLSGIAILLLIVKIREDKIKSTQQIEKSKLENQLLNQKLDSNKLELKRFTNLLIKNSEETKLLNAELEKVKKETNSASFKNLENLLNTRILTDDQWMVFKEKFTNVYPEFFYQLRNTKYTFSEAEERLLVLEKLNLKPKEIASILGIAGASVSRAKHRLRTKLSIDKTVAIIDFLKL